MSTKYRPSTLTAVLELVLVLSLGLIVVGIARGWFQQADSRLNGPLNDAFARVPRPPDETSEVRRTVSAPLWTTGGGTPSPFAATPTSADPPVDWPQNARTPWDEERRN